jgi:hypothetical protein
MVEIKEGAKRKANIKNINLITTALKEIPLKIAEVARGIICTQGSQS